MILLILAGYLFFLILTFPAIHAYQHLRQFVPDIKLGNLEGTIWNMSSDNLWIGNIPFHTSHASLNLLPLVTGKISLDINLKGRGTRTTASVNFQSKNKFQFYHLFL